MLPKDDVREGLVVNVVVPHCAVTQIFCLFSACSQKLASFKFFLPFCELNPLQTQQINYFNILKVRLNFLTPLFFVHTIKTAKPGVVKEITKCYPFEVNVLRIKNIEVEK